jgi:hypothetical protein
MAFTFPKTPQYGTLGGKSFYLNKYALGTPLDSEPQFNPGSYNWTFSQVTQAQNDPANVPGQGVTNPASWFDSHNLVLINGKLYDPSYGKIWNNLKDFRTNALQGFTISLQLKLDPTNKIDPVNGVDQNVLLFYAPGTNQADIDLARATPAQLVQGNPYDY